MKDTDWRCTEKIYNNKNIKTMKEILCIFSFVLCTGIFISCEDDNDSNPTLLSPSGFVLNTPSGVSGVYDLENTGTIELTCRQPDYGFTAATTYAVQVAVEQDFSDFVELSTVYTTAKLDANAKEMAVAIVGLLGVETAEDYPAETFPVYVRLAAKLTNGGGQALSNIIALPSVRGYFALEEMKSPETMNIIGNVAGNWNWTDATEMAPVHSNPGKFWAIQYLGKTDGGDNALIKFNMSKAWDDTAFGFDGAVVDDNSVALAGIAKDGDGNIEIGRPGWYLVVVTAEIDGRSYKYSVQFVEPGVYLQGSVAGGNWGTTDAAFRFAVPDIALGADAEFVSPAFVAAAAGDADGGVRASVILPGTEWWHTEFMVFDGVLKYRGDGGDQEPRVPGAAGQKLYINFTNRTGSIK
jgi:hypothetical protein